jgi:hypothetical protein
MLATATAKPCFFATFSAPKVVQKARQNDGLPAKAAPHFVVAYARCSLWCFCFMMWK